MFIAQVCHVVTVSCQMSCCGVMSHHILLSLYYNYELLHLSLQWGGITGGIGTHPVITSCSVS